MLNGYKTWIRIAVNNCQKSFLVKTVRCSSSSQKLSQSQTVAPTNVSEPEVPTAPPVELTPTEISTVTITSQKVESSFSKQQAQKELEDTFTPFRYVYPEFLPDPNLKLRNRIREKLERMDMVNRRRHVDIPEFYVGSILSVTTSDRNAPGKTNTFVGLCVEREGTGLRSTFTLRNHIDGMGLEICYDMYNPTIQNITCLRLEKRLDDNLRYLRDASPEYTTIPFDMAPELRNPDAPVPINPIKVKLNEKVSAKWHLWDLKGIVDYTDKLENWQLKKFKTFKMKTGYDVKEYDLMKHYRSTVPVEEQTEIYAEVAPKLTSISNTMKKQKKKRTFAKPTKTA